MSRIFCFFIYTLILTICIPILLPNFPLMFFAPFLVVCFYNRSLETCLWMALICGLAIDILSAHTRLGLYALNYCITTRILYSQKYHFFEDRLSTFSIMTFLFSFCSSMVQWGLLYLFGQGITISWEWLKTDLLWLPIVDACYAGLCFTLPYLLIPKPSKRRSHTISPNKDF